MPRQDNKNIINGWQCFQFIFKTIFHRTVTDLVEFKNNKSPSTNDPPPKGIQLERISKICCPHSVIKGSVFPQLKW